jgi:DNA-directed RNA polymerase specialized sigma24 family protein
VSVRLTTVDEAVAGALEAHRALLRNDATRLLRGSGEDPDDVLQDVHERVLVAARAGATGWETLPYLRRAVRNRCLDVLRARAARPATVELAADPPAGGDPAGVAADRERLAELVADIRALPERQREALLANVLAAPAGGPADGASKMLLLRARRNLRVVAVARATPCHEIRAALAASAERGVRASELARRHVLSCPGCQAHRAKRGLAGLFAPLLAWLASLGSEVGAVKVLAVVAITSGTVPVIVPQVRGGATEVAEQPARQIEKAPAARPEPPRIVVTPAPTFAPAQSAPKREARPAPSPKPRLRAPSSNELREAALAEPKVAAALDRAATPDEQDKMTPRQKQVAARRQLREEREAKRAKPQPSKSPTATPTPAPPAATATPAATPPPEEVVPPPAPTPTPTASPDATPTPVATPPPAETPPPAATATPPPAETV